MSKLVFFPWDAILASEQAKMQSWTATGDFRVDHYTGQSVKSVAGMAIGQMYIFGHCSSGSDTLSNDANNHLTYAEVADRLEESGLKKVFAGAIKIFACESGSPGTTMSFAKKFAKHIYFDKKYLLARVYGYKRPLNSGLSPDEEEQVGGVLTLKSTHKKAHKWATSDYWASAPDVNAVKAKDARAYFSPFGS